MAAISIDNCTVSQESLSGLNLYKIVTPATADDGDTIDASTYFLGTNVISARACGATDGSVVCVVTAAGTITLPGSTDDEARTIWVLAKSQ